MRLDAGATHCASGRLFAAQGERDAAQSLEQLTRVQKT